MTRGEEIHKMANTISTIIGKDVDEDYICNDEYDFTIGFECGAKWADEHPNLYNDEKYHTVKVSYLDELVRNTVLYEEFLEKACGWLKDWDRKTMYELSMIMGSKFIEDFRKAMEE